ncbi:MAG: hypothetical protein KAJ25_01515 [Desulfobacula sp.]|nr:hypothetical protein [Desulfobacula sp.]
MKTRDWQEYLSNKLSFSFMAKRIDDTDKAVWRGLKKDKPFSKGHIMKVLCVESEDDLYGIIVKVREGKQTAFIPVLDLEVVDPNGLNKKYLEEYAEWFAND